MIIEVIAAYFREEFLIPLFMQHYNWADRITLITQKNSSSQLDDEDKSNWVTDALRNSRADWTVVVDVDEFIYPIPFGANPRVVLEQETGSVIYSHMTRMWRHWSDISIKPHNPPVPQRVHGQKDHVKPAIFRPHSSLTLGAGNHDVQGHHMDLVGRPWAGAHWANADAQFWIERETRDRGPRLSQRNISRGHGTHTLRSAEQILAECKAHENDPVIIEI